MNVEPIQTPVEFWAVVELMGHQRIAGRLTEHTLAGSSFIRIDVPEGQYADGSPRQTQTFLQSPGSIYRVRLVDQACAMLAAAEIRVDPFSEYSLSQQIAKLNQAATHRALRHDPDDPDNDDYE